MASFVDTAQLLADVKALKARAARATYNSIRLRLQLEHAILSLRAAIQDSYLVRGKEEQEGVKHHEQR